MRNISLEDIARETRIHIHALRALEADDRPNLPAEVFVRGFVRNYAQYLGLSTEDVLNRYAQKGGGDHGARPGYNAREVLASETMAEPKEIWTFKNFLLLVLTGGILFAGYYFTKNFLHVFPGEKSSGLVHESGDAPSSAAVSPNVGSSAPAAVPEQEESVSPNSSAGGWSLNEPVVGPRSEAAPDTAVDSETEAPSVPPSPPVEEAPSPQTILLDQGEFYSASPALVADGETSLDSFGYTIRARFTELTWLELKLDSQDPHEFIFRPGEHHEWKAWEQADFYVGNAGGIHLTVNGQNMGALGDSGQVLSFSIPSSAPRYN